MQVSSFLPASAPVSPSSDPRPDTTRGSGFDSVYGEQGRSASRSADAPDDRGTQSAPAEDREQVSGNDEAGETDSAEETTEAENATSGGSKPSADEDSSHPDAVAADAEEDENAVSGDDAAIPDAPNPTMGIGESPSMQAKVNVDGDSDATVLARTAATVPSGAEEGTSSQTFPAGASAERLLPEQPAASAVGVARSVGQASAAEAVEAGEIVVRRVQMSDSANSTGPAEPARDAETRKVELSPKAVTAGTVAADPSVRPTVDAMAQFPADPAVAEAGMTEVRTTAEHAARTEVTVRHDTPRAVMQQVAEAARALRDGPVELTLKPEELGKVKMTMTAGSDGTMTMALQAERPETLDLLRRNIGDLARDLQAMGFSNLSFSFGQDRAHSDQARANGGAGEASDAPIAVVPLAGQGLAARPLTTPAAGGLDLRL